MNRWSPISVRVAIGFSTLILSCPGWGQSFNIDLDLPTDPPLGGGPPSDSFPGAAGQPGKWNALDATWIGAFRLKDLKGNSTHVTLTVVKGSGSAGGWSYIYNGNTGDYALLLNDIARVSETGSIYRFEGLSDGRYLLYSYAVNAIGYEAPVEVTVPGAFPPNPQIVTGPMPGNDFELGITHAVHTIDVVGGRLEVAFNATFPKGHINGFQIVAVPEPSSLLFITAFTIILFKRVRKNTSK
ncbi:MAG TPA: hypothetical protein VNK96_00840 [Fimbriimonadales bacterium]|nr:hypothetical protein [Fimbriimonadales bacterium]